MNHDQSTHYKNGNVYEELDQYFFLNYLRFNVSTKLWQSKCGTTVYSFKMYAWLVMFMSVDKFET